MIVLRYLTECRSSVVDGRCRRCQVAAMGELSFKLELCVADLRNVVVKMTLPGADSVGAALFPGMTATMVNALDRRQQDDIVESWTEVPISCPASC